MNWIDRFMFGLLTAEVAAQTVQDDSIIRGDGVRVRLYGIDALKRSAGRGKKSPAVHASLPR